jgi:hypothetical protein
VIAGVVGTGEQFISGDNDTGDNLSPVTTIIGEQFIGGVIDVPVVYMGRYEVVLRGAYP